MNRAPLEITPEFLRECLDYSPGTGELRWKERPQHHFSSRKHHLGWNTRYSGRLIEPRAGRYAEVVLCGKHHLAHRVIWMMVYGRSPNIIDHINHDKTDNRLANLRDVDRAENNRNITRLSKFGVTGVSRNSRDARWRARIKVDGREKFLGSFHSFDEALRARRIAEKLYGYHPNHGRVL